MNSIFKGKGIIVGYTAALLLAAGLAFALSALPSGAGRGGQPAHGAEYERAIALMDEGKMDEALELLNDLTIIYGDKYELVSYIEALKLYEKGKASHTCYFDAVYRLRDIPEDYAGPYAAQIRELRKRARDSYERGAAHYTPAPPPTPKFRPVTPSDSGGGDYDPYNAADFTGPEDFYEENRDAFDNIDDAEAYWQENS